MRALLALALVAAVAVSTAAANPALQGGMAPSSNAGAGANGNSNNNNNNNVAAAEPPEQFIMPPPPFRLDSSKSEILNPFAESASPDKVQKASDQQIEHNKKIGLAAAAGGMPFSETHNLMGDPNDKSHTVSFVELRGDPADEEEQAPSALPATTSVVAGAVGASPKATPTTTAAAVAGADDYAGHEFVPYDVPGMLPYAPHLAQVPGVPASMFAAMPPGGVLPRVQQFAGPWGPVPPRDPQPGAADGASLLPNPTWCWYGCRDQFALGLPAGVSSYAFLSGPTSFVTHLPAVSSASVAVVPDLSALQLPRHPYSFQIGACTGCEILPDP